MKKAAWQGGRAGGMLCKIFLVGRRTIVVLARNMPAMIGEPSRCHHSWRFPWRVAD